MTKTQFTPGMELKKGDKISTYQGAELTVTSHIPENSRVLHVPVKGMGKGILKDNIHYILE